MRKKVSTILLLVSLFALALGAVSPATNAAAQSSQNQMSDCDHASMFLVGRLAEIPGIQELFRETCDFRVRINQVNANVSRFDRRFIESAIAANMIEIQTLEYALPRTTNEELRGLIEMMIVMHTADLEMALEIAEKIGAETDPDLTDARVYPQTPLYDLGVRRINLVARFLDPLMSVPGGTATPTQIPTGSPTGVATGTGTVLPTSTPTIINTATMVATGTNTAIATGTATDVATGTSTIVVTSTGTTATTGTVTVVGTGTSTANPTGTATTVPTGTNTATSVPTETSTAVPTVIVPPRPDFDMLALHVLEDEHAMHIETALVAQRLVKNNEIRAFAKHAADVAKLHMLLLNDLKYRLAHGYTLPEPHFEEDYQSPRRFEPLGEDN